MVKLLAKKALHQLTNWVNTHFTGAAEDVINYGAVASVTPERSGWLVASAATQSPTPSLPPIMRINGPSGVVGDATGILYATGVFYASAYVKAGEHYTISAYRASLVEVKLYY